MDPTNFFFELLPYQHLPNVNINSDGFRGTENTIEKSGDVCRIFDVGGANTFGMGTTCDFG